MVNDDESEDFVLISEQEEIALRSEAIALGQSSLDLSDEDVSE